jgi:hypothetical protein
MASPTDAVLIATMHHRHGVLSAALERAGWTVRGYQDVSAALTHLKERPYAAVFCDEFLRGASASGFLAWSRRLNPDVPFYVFAMRGEEAALGARHEPDRVLAFPPSDAELPRPTTVSHWDGPPPGLRDLPLEGTTGLVGLGDLIEMLAVTSASSVVVLDEGRVGRVYLHGGQLEHAVHVDHDAETVGVRALSRLLDLADVPFQLLPYRQPSRRTVHVPTAAALTEASRLIDEQRRDRALLRAVTEACPDALGIAVGYVLNDAPTVASGDGATAFTVGLTLLESTKPAVGPATHLCVEGERYAHAVLAFGHGHVVAAHAPRGRSLVLLSSLVKALKRTST